MESSTELSITCDGPDHDVPLTKGINESGIFSITSSSPFTSQSILSDLSSRRHTSMNNGFPTNGDQGEIMQSVANQTLIGVSQPLQQSFSTSVPYQYVTDSPAGLGANILSEDYPSISFRLPSSTPVSPITSPAPSSHYPGYPNSPHQSSSTLASHLIVPASSLLNPPYNDQGYSHSLQRSPSTPSFYTNTLASSLDANIPYVYQPSFPPLPSSPADNIFPPYQEHTAYPSQLSLTPDTIPVFDLRGSPNCFQQQSSTLDSYATNAVPSFAADSPPTSDFLYPPQTPRSPHIPNIPQHMPRLLAQICHCRRLPALQRLYEGTSPRRRFNTVGVDRWLIPFLSVSGECGIAVADAIAGNFGNLFDRDDHPLVGVTSRASITVRFEFCGYKPWRGSVRTRDYTSKSSPTQLSKLARGISLLLVKCIDDIVKVPFDEREGRGLILGPGYTRAEDLVLVGLEQVSQGSCQAHFHVKT